jgi:hypothetical protein
VFLCCALGAIGQTGRRLAGQPAPPMMPNVQAAGCPEQAVVTPAGTLLLSDFVELHRSACFGLCPVYTIRIQADGQIVWHGDQFVQAIGERAGQDASALIERFRGAGFWNLCASYTRSVTDVPTAKTLVSIGDQLKGVSDRADGAPDWLRELDRAVDELADTHRWIHGDSQTENFAAHLNIDARGPKPGLTPLMQASGKGDLGEVEALLNTRADPNARDSSGWTALMYATQAQRSDVIRKLLDTGADPRISSYQGETAVMAAATAFYQPEEKLRLLLTAGAGVNEQNREGQTALMYAVRRFERAEGAVSVLMEAGARTDLRDARA